MYMKRLFILLIIVCTVAITGCQNNEEANPPTNEDGTNLIRVKSPDGEEKKENKSGQEIAAHLVEIASSIPNVNDATAVVVGRYAVVGIDVNSKIDRSRVGTIKYSVAESLKKDRYGANAVVISDPDTFVRLEQMADQIRNGHPIKGIAEELAAIVGRLIPQIPSEVDLDNQPTEQNQKQLSDKEEKKLDKQQDEQAKKETDQ